MGSACGLAVLIGRKAMKSLVAFVSVALGVLGMSCMDPAHSGSSGAVTERSGHPNAPQGVSIQEFAVLMGSGPHDTAPAPDGSVWFTAQLGGALGNLDPAT